MKPELLEIRKKTTQTIQAFATERVSYVIDTVFKVQVLDNRKVVMEGFRLLNVVVHAKRSGKYYFRYV